MKRSSASRVAVLADIHGNIDALEAVLSVVEHEPPDLIVIGGDVAAGPFPVETLKRVIGLQRARFVQGNADREVVEAFDQHIEFDPEDDDVARKTAAWVAARLRRDHRDFIAGFEDRVALAVAGIGEVLFCHGSPRRDDEIMTSRTPDQSMRELLAGVDQRLVVCGHTHVQFDRTVDDTRVVNAGSVGMAYQGVPGAYWLRLGPQVTLQHTPYEHEQAADRIRASDYPDAESLALEVILSPPDPQEVEVFFASVAAKRGERPGVETSSE